MRDLTALPVLSPHGREARLLRAIRDHHGRLREGAFLVEGVRCCEEYARAGVLPLVAVVDPYTVGQHDRQFTLVAWLLEQGVHILQADEQLFLELADTVTPQGLIAAISSEAVSPDQSERRRKRRPRPLTLLLDSVSDPGNLGTILRTAYAADARAVLLTKGCAEVLSPKVVRAATGAQAWLPIWARLDMAQLRQRLLGQKVYGAASSGGRPYDKIAWMDSVTLAIGSEAHGLSPEIQELCREVVSIPIAGGVESLNAAVAAGIILFEAQRQQRSRARKE